ncbi:MAG: substrate-binding domain-containing protein [Chloroflexi bacterium]|nr:substrate-binding domain-containing protein [Chloroflexota bacterium]
MLDKTLIRRLSGRWLQRAAAAIFISALGVLPSAPVFSQGQSTIALIIGIKGDPFYITMGKGAQAEADSVGVNLIVDGPSQAADTVGQTAMVDAMIARKVDAIMIAAVDKQAMIPPLQRANDAGVKVISLDTYIGDGDYANGQVTFPLSYIGSDNIEGGRIGCQALIDGMGGTGKLYIQNVNANGSTVIEREQGCKNAIDASKGAVQLVGVDYNNDSAAIAAQQTSAVLQRVPDLNGVFGTNLFSAEGAAQAVKNANLAGVVKVANFDAPEQAIADLRANVVDLVIAQQPYLMGTTGIDYAVKAISGDTTNLQKRVPTGYVLITRDNVDSPEAQQAIYKNE